MPLLKNIVNKDKPEREDIIAEIEEMNIRIDEAHTRFNDVIDCDLIDACIYEINSLESMYKYLMQQLKSQKKL